MPRNHTHSALTLRVKASGESNREAWFLTEEAGLLRATVFGGAKSRLRSHVAPFHEGSLVIYHDPVKDSRKVCDFDVQIWRPGLRELWERAASAGALAETILSSQGGGGNWPEALKLASSVLDILNTAPVGACSRITTYFLWQWSQILGVKPDLCYCSVCSSEFKPEEFLWYSGRKESVFCERCASNPETLLRVGSGCRLWLTEIESLPPFAIANDIIQADAQSQEQAKTLAQAVLSGVLGKKLTTWEGI